MATDFPGDINVAGAVIATGDVECARMTGVLIVAKANASVGGDLSVGAGLAVTGGDITGSKRVLATGDVAGGRLIANGDASVAGSLSVTGGDITGAHGVLANGDVAGGRLIANGDASVKGDLTVHGDILLSNQDCAEDFDVSGVEEIKSGSVMVLNDEGALQMCGVAYDKRVAGVISGAGDMRPGIILGRQKVSGTRMPIALLGKAYCRVDANLSPVEVGDLLTTSPTLGHAMKAVDLERAFGAVIGKALRPLRTGTGLIPILIALQ